MTTNPKNPDAEGLAQEPTHDQIVAAMNALIAEEVRALGEQKTPHNGARYEAMKLALKAARALEQREAGSLTDKPAEACHTCGGPVACPCCDVEQHEAGSKGREGFVLVPRGALLEVLRISDREHDAWRAVKAAIAEGPRLNYMGKGEMIAKQALGRFAAAPSGGVGDG